MTVGSDSELYDELNRLNTELINAQHELKKNNVALQEAHAQLEERVHERTAELQQARDEAERANAARSEFVSRMSHDLRTPLNSILGFTQLMEMDGLSPVQVVRLAHITRAGQRLLQLIDALLDPTSSESKPKAPTQGAASPEEGPNE